MGGQPQVSVYISHIADHAGWEPLAGQGVERCKGGACLMAGMEYGGIRAVLRASYLWLCVGGILAGRSDLADQTKAEMAVLEKYMPKQLTEDEVAQIVRDAIAGQDVSSLKMGDVMKLVMPKVKGRADGKLVSQTVRKILQNK